MNTWVQTDRVPAVVRRAHFLICENYDRGGTFSTGYNRLCKVSEYEYRTVNVYNQAIGSVTIQPVSEEFADKYDAALNGYVHYVSEEHDRVFYYDVATRYVVTVHFEQELRLTLLLKNSFITASYDWFVQELKQLEQYMSWYKYITDTEKDFGLEEDEDEDFY